MIRYECSGDTVCLYASGRLEEITAEVVQLIQLEYGRLYRKDIDAARLFREMVVFLVTDAGSPVFDPEQIQRPENGIDIAILSDRPISQDKGGEQA